MNNLRILNPSSITKARGIALIEALIATGVLVGGMAAAFGIHSMVVGNSAQNRIDNLAMSAAQAKVEEFRSVQFDEIAGGSDTWPTNGTGFTIPGIGANTSVVLERCWTVTEEAATLARVQVGVVRQGENCDPTATNLRARIDTLIAMQDPRIAAVSLADQIRADGEALRVTDYEGSPDSTPTTGGFALDWGEDGSLAAIYNPMTGDALLPLQGRSLRVAFISGNLLIEGQLSVAQVEDLRVNAEANAICNIFYPGNTPPSVSNTQSLTYVQYTCIVPNQWRRAIFVTAPGRDICVGDPYSTLLFQGVDPLTNEYFGADVFFSRARQYSGFAFRRDLDGERIPLPGGGGFAEWPAGVRGATLRQEAPRLEAAMGSVCEEDEACWDDTLVRGLVPGGHHFFLMNRSEGRYCIEAMESIFDDLNDGGDGLANFTNIIRGNPHRRYCTNEKDFPFPGFGSNESIYCRSQTNVSGFVTPDARSDGSEILQPDLSDISIAISGDLPDVKGCRLIGPFGQTGGAYNCFFEDQEDPARSFTVTPSTTLGIEFEAIDNSVTPAQTLIWPRESDEAKHDFVKHDFLYREP